MQVRHDAFLRFTYKLPDYTAVPLMGRPDGLRLRSGIVHTEHTLTDTMAVSSSSLPVVRHGRHNSKDINASHNLC